MKSHGIQIGQNFQKAKLSTFRNGPGHCLSDYQLIVI